MDEEVERDLTIMLAERQLEEAKERMNTIYKERNLVVLLAAKLAFESGHRAWLRKHPETDPDWDPKWMWIVFIEIPRGQLSWHIHESERSLFDFLPILQDEPWDGHTMDQKYGRIIHWPARREPKPL